MRTYQPPMYSMKTSAVHEHWTVQTWGFTASRCCKIGNILVDLVKCCREFSLSSLVHYVSLSYVVDISISTIYRCLLHNSHLFNMLRTGGPDRIRVCVIQYRWDDFIIRFRHWCTEQRKSQTVFAIPFHAPLHTVHEMFDTDGSDLH